jgi:peptidoglycan/LPS O-acetylase OafA/YrhL
LRQLRGRFLEAAEKELIACKLREREFSRMWLAVIIILMTRIQGWTPSRARSRAERLTRIAISVAAIIVGGILIYDAKPRLAYRDTYFLVGLVPMAAIVVADIFWFRRPWVSPMMLSLLCAASIFMATTVGIHTSLGSLQPAPMRASECAGRTSASRLPQRVQVKTGSISDSRT